MKVSQSNPTANESANPQARILVVEDELPMRTALHDILTGTADPNTCPAAGVRLASGTLIWWVDRDAAAQQVDPD